MLPASGSIYADSHIAMVDLEEKVIIMHCVYRVLPPEKYKSNGRKYTCMCALPILM